MGDIDDAEFSQEVWRMLETYFSHNHEHQLVKHLIDSFNDFISKRIEQIMDGFNPIEVHHCFDASMGGYKYEIALEITNPTVTKPTIHEKDGTTKLMTPNDARIRGFTYAAPLLVDVAFTAKTKTADGIVTERKMFSGVR